MSDSTPHVSWYCPCGVTALDLVPSVHAMLIRQLRVYGAIRLSGVPTCHECGGYPAPIRPSEEAVRRG